KGGARAVRSVIGHRLACGDAAPRYRTDAPQGQTPRGRTRRLVLRLKHLGDLEEMRIDALGHVAEMAPLLAELGQMMRPRQELAVLPLDVIDDAPAIEALVQADRHEAGLARHEA